MFTNIITGPSGSLNAAVRCDTPCSFDDNGKRISAPSDMGPHGSESNKSIKVSARVPSVFLVSFGEILYADKFVVFKGHELCVVVAGNNLYA